MRKVLPITLIFLLLTLSMTPLATAQKQNIIVNETTETLYVISSTKFGAQGDIPAGYRTSGWKTIAAGQQRVFWAYDPHKIYFQIWKGSEPIKPQRSTDTLAFWINRNANFDIVTRQEINASITRAQLLYSSHGTDPLTHQEGFMRYNNGSRITVTDAWVDVDVEGLDPPGEGAETEEPPEEDAGAEEEPPEEGDGDGEAPNGGLAQDGDGEAPMEEVVAPNTPVNIPDPQLRAAIEDALNKAPGDTITVPDMQKLTALSAIAREIQYLTGLEFAINLTRLDLYNNQIIDISSLVSLTNLTTLTLENNAIWDVSALAGLTNLTTLYLGGNELTDISPLAGLTNLGDLDLAYNAIWDVSPLAGLTNLVALYLNDNAISNFSPIAGLIPNLEFYLNSNQRAFVPPIPDSQLRAAIERELGKAEGDTITVTDMQKLTVLYGRWNDIQDLRGIEFATNLTELFLEYNAIRDVSPLAGLANLTELELSYNAIRDISPLAGLTNLTRLRLDENQITDVSSLAGLTNLTRLDLNNNQITDIVLTGLTNLMWLELDYNQITDIALAGLTNLKQVRLSYNEITDVSTLGGLTNLTYLYLDYNQITDVSTLGGLTNLKQLDLEYNAIFDFSPIAGLIPNLEFYSDANQRAGGWHLNDIVNIPDPGLRNAIKTALRKPEDRPITKTDMEGLTIFEPYLLIITDLTGLEFATNLTTLWLDGGEIRDVSPLAELTNLTTLKVVNGKLSDVSPLAGLTNLTELWLFENEISDVSPLAGLTNLTELWLGGNQLTDVSPLTGLTNLTGLSLSDNNISDMSPLASLINLTSLGLAYNNISDVSLLSGLTNLTSLSLWSNAISDVSPLSGLTNLTSLSLSENSISDVSPLAKLTNLTSLGLAYNNISDFTPLDGLKAAGVEINTQNQGFVEISEIGYLPLDAGVSVSVSGITPGKLRLERDLRSVLTYTVVNEEGEPVPGITLSLFVIPISGAEFEPSTIITDAKGQATTRIYFDRAGEFDLWTSVRISEKTTNEHGSTVYKQYDGNETVLIKGLALSDVHKLTYDHTQFFPPRHGKHFRVYGQGNANTCGQTSARMVLSYYGVDVGLDTFDDMARIETRVVGATPEQMITGLALLPVDLATYHGTSETYPRDKLLRDKISESLPPILVIRVAENGYHHIVVVGYDTRTNSFLIADPVADGGFYWLPWAYLDPQWRLDYVPGYTWDDFWEDPTHPNTFGKAPSVPDVRPDVKFAFIKWFGGLKPYRMFVPEEAPPYHHLASETHEIHRTGPVNPFDDIEWHDWEWEHTFSGKVLVTSWFGWLRDADVRETRRESNKVIVSGKIADGSRGIQFPVGNPVYGSVDIVLTVYYDPSAMAAPSVVLPPLSKETVLLPNYPNPFNPETWIPYHLAEPADVTLTIYSVDGKVVRRLDLGHQDTGYYQSKARAAYWDGRNSVGERVASGLYFYTLTAGDFAATRKMLIMK